MTASTNPPAVFSLLCICDARIVFDEAARGQVVTCPCGRMYRVPTRASVLGRALGRVSWALRWLRATPRRALPPSVRVPYRTGRAPVACPQCKAVPDADSRWQCEFCYCLWNTFDTRGTCPGCSFRFRATSCLVCKTSSRHDDWYLPPPRL